MKRFFFRIIKISFILALLYGLNFVFTKQVNPYITQIINLIGINIILAVSLNLINGHTGQFSIGHAGFMAIGAYGSAAVTVYGQNIILAKLLFVPMAWATQIFFIGSLLFGGLLAALAGLIVGIPTLRLRGDYLAIATLGFGEIIRVIVLNLDFVGGARGFGGIPEFANFFWIYFFAFITVLWVSRLIQSTKGKGLLAVREDEIAAESIGLQASRLKVFAFTAGAFFAGIGGGLFAHLITYLHTNSFTFLKSIEIIVMVVLGGMGSITGSILAAAALTVLPEALRVANEWRMVFYALLLIIMMILRPQGLMADRELRILKR